MGRKLAGNVYSIRVLGANQKTKLQAGLIISSYVIYFISDGQTEGGLTSIQPEARTVNLHLELFGGIFSSPEPKAPGELIV